MKKEVKHKTITNKPDSITDRTSIITYRSKVVTSLKDMLGRQL